MCSSYNAWHGSTGIYELLVTWGWTGGVESSTGEILGLRDSADRLLYDQYIFAIKSQNGKTPFSDNELKQILSELKTAIYEHDTTPFFSLHFREDGLLYPVLHPAYQGTLVGEVIGYLDYFMKGFLNGGIFSKEMLEEWQNNQNMDRGYLKAKWQDIKKICKDHDPKIQYLSLRELKRKNGINEQDFINKIITSFRIIARQNAPGKHDNAFFINPDFDVTYSVDVMPEYQEYLDKHHQEHGRYPKDYEDLLSVYKLFTHEVKDKMPQIPFCRDYFEMLGIINFFCYYFTTLKNMGVEQELATPATTRRNASLKVLPPIPVRYYESHDISLKVEEVILNLLAKEQATAAQDTLDNYLFDSYWNSRELEPATGLFNRMKGAISDIIKARLIGKTENPELDEDFLDMKTTSTLNTLLNCAFNIGDIATRQIIELQNKQITFYIIEVIAQLEIILIREQFLKLFDSFCVALEARYVQAHLSQETKMKMIIGFSDKLGIKLCEEQYESCANSSNIKTVKLAIDLDETATQELADKKLLEDFASFMEGYVEQPTFKNEYQNLSTDEFISAVKNWVGLALKIQINVKMLNKTYEAAADKIKYINEVCSKAMDAIKSFSISRFEALRQKELKESPEQQYKGLYSSICEEGVESIRTVLLQNIEMLCKEAFKNFTKTILQNKRIKEASLLPGKYLHGAMQIADGAFIRESGDNLNIVGGCGMKLPNITLRPVMEGEQFARLANQAILGKEIEAFQPITIEGQTYYVFALPMYKEPAQTVNDPYIEHQQNIIDVAQNKAGAIFDSKLCKDTHFIQALAKNPQSDMLQKLITQQPDVLSLADKHGYLPIHIAAMYGNNAAIVLMLDKQPDLLERKTSDDYTPYMLAIQKNHIDTVKLLQSRGANPEVILPNGMYPLFLAVQNGNAEVANTILDHFPNLNVSLAVDSGITPLHLAVILKMPELAIKLIKHGANLNARKKSDNYTPFHYAVKDGQIAVVDAIINTGFNVNTPVSTTSTEYKTTALHIAARQGNFEMIKFLVSKHIDVNTKNMQSETALMVAIFNIHHEAAVYLAALTAINLINKNGETASVLAAKYNMFEVADALIARGEIPYLADKSQRHYVYYLLFHGEYLRFTQLGRNTDNMVGEKSYLAIAAERGHNLLVDYLLNQKEAYINKSSNLQLIHFMVKSDNIAYLKQWLSDGYNTADYIKDCKSLVCLAAESGSLNCLKILLPVSGAEEISKADNGRHLVVAAIKSGNTDIIEAVLRYCDDINMEVDKALNTVAHIAVISGRLNIIKSLYAIGASFAKSNADNLSAYHLAIKNDDEKALQLMIRLSRQAPDLPSDLLSFTIQENKPKCHTLLLKSNISFANVANRKNADAFVAACVAGELDKIVAMIADNDVNEGYPLHNAIINGQAAVVDLLLTLNADSKQLYKGMDAFATAVHHSQIGIIRLLHNKKLLQDWSDYTKFANSTYVRNAINGDWDFIDKGVSLVKFALGKQRLVTLRNKLKDFPINTMMLGGMPLLHQLFKCEISIYETFVRPLLKSIAESANPMIKDVNGDPLIFTLLEESGEDAATIVNAKLGWLKRFFPGQYRQIIEQKNARGFNIFDVATQSGKLEVIEAMTDRPEFSNSKPAIHLAVMSNNLLTVQKILAMGASPDATNENDTTPLMIAAENNRVDIANLLLNAGANSDLQSNRQETALHVALGKKHIDMAITLIGWMKNPDVKNCDGITPLMLAAHNNLVPVIKRLAPHCQLEQFDKVGMHALHHAVAEGHIEAIKVLLALGVNINLCTSGKKSKIENGLTPIIIAAQFGRVEAFRYLFEMGADITKKGSNGTTVFSAAIMSKSESMFREIRGLPNFYEAQYHCEMVSSAAKRNNVMALRQLYLAGVKLDETNNDGLNALHIACINRSYNAAQFLIEQGFPLEIAAPSGDRAIHIAALSVSSAIVFMLAKHGASVNAVNISGETPLYIACMSGKYQVVLQLLYAGADINIKNEKTDLNAVQIAAQNNFSNISRLFYVIQNPDQANDKEKTLLKRIEYKKSNFEKIELPCLPSFDSDPQVVTNSVKIIEKHIEMVHEYDHIKEFKNSLLRIGVNELNRQEKALLSQFYFKALGDQKFNKVNEFIALAVRIKNELGITLFRVLFSERSTSPALNELLEVMSILLDIADEVGIKKCIDMIKKEKLSDLKKHLELEHARILALKYPESNIDELAEKFLTPGEFVKNPLPRLEIEQLKQDYLTITSKYSPSLKTISQAELSLLAEKVSIKLKSNPQDKQASLQMLAIIREMVRHHFYGIYPYNTQMFVVLAFIYGSEKIKGRIAQIKTGEGKSTIIAMLAVFFASQNRLVDIITTSQNLAERDHEKYQSFYSGMGVSSTNICVPVPGKEKFAGQIVYGANYDFEFSILREQLKDNDARTTNKERRKCDIAIVDEVDSLFIDSASNSARISISSMEDYSWIYEPFFKYVSANPNQKFIWSEVRAALCMSINQKYIPQLNEFKDEFFDRLLESVKTAMEREEGKHYIFELNKRGEKIVVIMDYENTGRKKPGSRWSRGVHQFIEVKHGIKPEAEDVTGAAISHTSFFKKYRQIFGLTGTIGEEKEREELTSEYNVDSYDVPPHFPNIRKKLDPLWVANIDIYYNALVISIENITKQNRPVLVLVKTIKDSIALSAHLKLSGIKYQLLNEVQQENEAYIIARAGMPGVVTVATNNAGRGTDIILTSDSKKQEDYM